MAADTTIHSFIHCRACATLGQPPRLEAGLSTTGVVVQCKKHGLVVHISDGGHLSALWKALGGSSSTHASGDNGEQTLTWRGSRSDFVTDLLELLGPEGVEKLCAEGLSRVRAR